MNQFYKQLIFITLGVAIIVTGGLGIWAVNNRGAAPVGYWKFDEGYASTTYDSGTGDNDGTLTGGLKWKNEPECRTGKCLSFDGSDDYVSVADVASLDITDAITLSAWIKTSEAAGDYPTIIGKRSGTTANYVLYLSNNAKLRFVFYNGAWKADSPDTTIVLNDGIWHHVAVTYDKTNYIYFIDGVQRDSFSETATMVANSVAVEIGHYVGGASDRYFEDQIDDVRIYNYALTQQQIQNVYNGGSAVRFGPSSGLP